MSKFLTILVLLPILLPILVINIRAVNSLECYECKTKFENGIPQDKDCDQGNGSLTKAPCKEPDQKKEGEVAVCFKINGTGTRPNGGPTLIRGCWYGQHSVPYKTYEKDLFIYPPGTDEYNLKGKLYTCITDFCNSSNSLNYSLVLLASFAGLSLFFKTHFTLI